MFDRQGEYSEAFWYIFFHPGGEFRGGFDVNGNDFFESGLGGYAVMAIKDTADIAGDFGTLIESWDIGLGVLLEMELTALPWDAWEDGGTCGFESEVVVANDELDAAKSALDEALKEGSPVDFGFAEGDADAE